MSEQLLHQLAALSAALAASSAAWLALRSPWALALLRRGALRDGSGDAGNLRTWVVQRLDHLMRPLVAPLARHLPSPAVIWLGRLLRRAGHSSDDAVAVAAWLLRPVPLSPVFALAAIALRLPWPALPGLAAALWLLRALALRRAARRRELAVLRELPFHLEMLALALESGATLLLALHASLPRAPAGPVRDAFAALLADVQAGRLRLEAIAALQRRLDYPCVQPLTAALLRAERSGAGLAQQLRIQAEQRRHERFHRAETLALQAPVRMLGPLVLCIFPGTFLVLAFVVYMRSTAP